jgi:sulfur-carrier protein adenylyltransferase/sulfurtransferase
MVTSPLNYPAHPPDATLSPAELARYNRHIVLPQVGDEGQRRLKAASVIVVGTGGLGSPLALYLAAAGIGRIGLVDDDRVDDSNLQRQVVHSQPARGMPKVESAAARLRALNPFVTIDTYQARLTSDNALDILQPYDIILDGTDNFPARYLLSDAAVLLDKPLVYGSVFRFEGQVSVFGLPDGPCYRCLLPEPPPPYSVPSCAEAGVLGVLPGTIGTIQATEALKLILGIGAPLAGRLLLYDALDMSFDLITLPKRPDCPACSTSPTVTELIDYEAFCGIPARDRQEAHPTERDPATIRHMSPGEVQAQLESGEQLVLLDIREPYELHLSRLDHTLHIPMSEMAARWEEIPRDQTVVVFCHAGIRSVNLIRQLQAAGFTNLINMAGGIDAWSRQVDASIPRY